MSYLDLDYQGLLNHLNGAQVGSQQHEMAKALLHIRNLEAQGKSAEALVRSTDELVKATKSLGRFTLALVWVTIVLVVVTAVSLFLRPDQETPKTRKTENPAPISSLHELGTFS